MSSQQHSRLGQILINKGLIDRSQLDAAIQVQLTSHAHRHGVEAGVEDVQDRGEQFMVLTDPSAMVAARTALVAAGMDYESADVEFVPSMSVQVDAETASKAIRLIDALEDSDEVQNVYSNFDVSAEVLAELERT